LAFSYDAGGDSDKDTVRLLIGDTDPEVAAQQRLEDEEITRLVAIHGSYQAAAPHAADALAAKFSRLVTKKGMGQASLEWDRFNFLRTLAKDLRRSLALSAVPFAGGLSKSRRDTNRQNTDLVQPKFERGMLDHDSAFNGSTTSTAA
jgi:hypothetical protein